jgi:hypothetical protein
MELNADLRAELHALAEEHNIPRLHQIADTARRRPAISIAPRAANPTTPELRARIVAMKAEHPDMLQSEIAALLGVNHGRVSAALNPTLADKAMFANQMRHQQ